MISNKAMTETLINDAHGIHYGSLTNTDQVKSYSGGKLPTMNIEGKEVLVTFGAIYGAQRKAWADAVLTGPIDAESTREIIECVCSTIEHSIPETMVAIEAKQHAFEASGMTEIVKNSLELMLHHHKTNAAVLKDKFCTEDEKLLDDFKHEAQDITLLMERVLALFA